MALFIPYQFDDTLGRFLHWDTIQELQGSKGYLATNSHVDLRAMLGENLSIPRPLNELELVIQDELESNTDYTPLLKLEEKIRVAGDNWIKTGTGFDTMAVGPNATPSAPTSPTIPPHNVPSRSRTTHFLVSPFRALT